MYRQAHYRALPGAGPKRAEKIAPCIPKRLKIWSPYSYTYMYEETQNTYQ
jgi:hypothetical protein